MQWKQDSSQVHDFDDNFDTPDQAIENLNVREPYKYRKPVAAYKRELSRRVYSRGEYSTPLKSQ